jgi:hypothetical protein
MSLYGAICLMGRSIGNMCRGLLDKKFWKSRGWRSAHGISGISHSLICIFLVPPTKSEHVIFNEKVFEISSS